MRTRRAVIVLAMITALAASTTSAVGVTVGSATTIAALAKGAPVSLHLRPATAIVATEARDGAFFYAPQPQRDSFGRVKPGTPDTNVVRVIDGHSAPTIAEHAPGVIVGLAAGARDLYVATQHRVIRYSRTTGAEVRSWRLLKGPVTHAEIVLGGHWMYVSTGFQCDACGLEYNTLLSINLVAGKRRVLSKNVTPTSIAANAGHVFYFLFSGGLVRSTPTGNLSAANFTLPDFSYALGLYGGRLLVWSSAAGSHRDTVRVVDPTRMTVIERWRVASAPYFELVPSTTGEGLFSDAACPPGISAALCGVTSARA